MKNVCIVGFGNIAPLHAAAIEKTDSARLYAVCDIDTEKMQTLSDEILKYTDFDEMLKNDKIDSLHICTPHYLHFEMIKKAVNAGKDVVTEKPLVMKENELDSLLALKNGKSEKIAVVFQNRLNPCVLRLHNMILSGKLGKLKTVRANMLWHRDMNYYNSAAWRGTKLYEGGGVMINQAIHTLDLVGFLGGGFSQLRAVSTNFSLPEIEVEDTCAAYFSLKNGASGILFATNAYGENSAPDIEVVFEFGRVRYFGGKLYLDDEIIECDEKPKMGKSYWGSGHSTLIRNFYDKGEYFSPLDAENTMRALFAIYESANCGGEPKSVK